jgi:hypothetical protein
MIPLSIKCEIIETCLSQVKDYGALRYFDFDRPSARTGERSSVSGPLIRQLLGKLSPYSDAVRVLNRRDIPWRNALADEVGMDLGGLGREIFTEIATEFLDPNLGLFIQTPNARRQSGGNHGYYIPHPGVLEPYTKREQM